MRPVGAYESILFPVDFSEACFATAPHVQRMAELTGATVTLLHVIPWLAAWYGVSELRPEVTGDALLRNLERESEAALGKFRSLFFADIPTHTEVSSGAVAETIVDVAANWGCDLIMMPTRGLGRSRPFLIGSTTAKVLHDARCAVWTSPHPTNSNIQDGYGNIVCSLDKYDVPPGYIEEVMRLATTLSAKLTFVTAVPSRAGGYGEEHRVESIAHEFPQAHLQHVHSAPDCKVMVETGDVGNVIRKAVQAQGADLVVINRGHIRHQFGRFRTHTYEIVLECPCPVISLCVHLPEPHEDSSKRKIREGVFASQ